MRKVFRNDGYEIVIWDHGHLKVEGTEVVAYYYDGPYPPKARPAATEIRHPLAGPAERDSTEAIGRAFVEAVANRDESGLRSTFASSMNSLAAVLAANVSHERGGERIDLEQFLTGAVYESYRKKAETG